MARSVLRRAGLSVRSLISYHDHNERSRAKRLVQRLSSGEQIPAGVEIARDGMVAPLSETNPSP